MANVSYPIYGKVKTVVLPIPQELIGAELTIDEYKEKYGVDLREVIEVDANDLTINVKRGFYLLVDALDYVSMFQSIFQPMYTYDDYVSGNVDGFLRLGINDGNGNMGHGLVLKIDKDDTFTIENLQVYHDEL